MNTALFRSLIIFGVCIVLAIWLGLSLAGQLTSMTLVIYGVLGFILVFPLLLRWHYPLLLLSWNMTVVVPFLSGRPALYLPMVVLSLGISVLQRAISRESQFIKVPQITVPLFFMIGVIAITARLTGVGLHAFGSDVYGGKKYVYLVIGILGYFALSARQIPLKRKNLYVGLFFLGGLTAFVGDLYPILPHSLYFIYYLFNVDIYTITPLSGFGTEGMRLAGAVTVATGVLSYMLARYGIRGIFLSRRPLRWLTFLLFSVYALFGGFRGFIVIIFLLLAIQFFLEGLYRTKLLPVILVSGIIGALALIPLASHLPYTFQRALSVLPYKVNNAARMEAQESSDWRIRMWQGLLPQIPQYLLLGKGYVISPMDYNFVMGPEASIRSTFAENQGMALAEDFHNGPISVVIPFGIWGCLAVLWFLAAGAWALYRNYRYSDPALQTANTFLFAAFLMHVIFFMLIYGDFSADMPMFCGLLGFSVSLNGGVRRRVRATRTISPPQKTAGFTPLRPAPVPAFQRRQPGISR
jgi:hypothetical protein